MLNSANASIVALITSPLSPRRSALRLSGPRLPAQVGAWLNLNTHERWSYKATKSLVELELETGIFVKVPVTLFTMPEKASYTFEPVVEMHLPANELISRRILEHCYSLGLRPAEPGEFTRRAFLNGRISLGQAGAVAELIASEDKDQRARALKHLEGAEGDLLEKLRHQLFIFRRELEATLDFPEEIDLNERADFRWQVHLNNLLDFSQKALKELNSKVRGEASHLRVLLLGAANAGKSSLIRALVPNSQPVVSHIPGTTLDLVPYQLEHEGHTLVLYDSPGLKEEENQLDTLSLENLKKRIPDFDAYLLLQPSNEIAFNFPPLPAEHPKQLLLSKWDLYPKDAGEHPLQKEALSVSALYHSGFDPLWQSLKKWSQQLERSPWKTLESRLLHLVQEKLPVLQELLLCSYPQEELAAVELDELLMEIDALLYTQSGGEALLDSIFRDFCIGK